MKKDKKQSKDLEPVIKKLQSKIDQLSKTIDKMIQTINKGIQHKEKKTPVKAKQRTTKTRKAEPGANPKTRSSKTGTQKNAKTKTQSTAKARIAPETAKPLPKEKREEVITQIKTLRKAGSSYDEIANRLDKQGVPTLSGRGKWRKQTVHKILKAEGL